MSSSTAGRRQASDRPVFGNGRGNTLAPFILLAPASFMFAVFVVYPITANIRLSFYHWDGVGQKTWAGIANYQELIADPTFWTALVNNLLWLAIYLLAPVLGLGLALFLNQTIAGIRIVRSLFFMPFVISQVVVGLMFSWFLNSHFGLLNELLGVFGMGPLTLLESDQWAVYAVILAGLWPQIAYCMILYLTGLTMLDQELIDAARVDGASGWRLLWYIVLPQLRPVSFIVALVCVVGALRSFDLVMIMTRGGPYNSSTVLAFYMYEQTFLNLRFGYGAAVATVLFALMSGVVVLFLWRLLRRETEAGS
jgi:multiple sugar transport system permease protein